MTINQPPPENDITKIVAELLHEFVLEKRMARERAEKEGVEKKNPVSGWQSFWKWLKENGTSLTTLLTVVSVVVGALWTLNQFIVQQNAQTLQQQREADLRRQSLIVQFASDFSDKNKRNTAAYNLAILSGKDAVPFLISQLVQTSKTNDDSDFQGALQQALITVDEPAIEPILQLNRQIASQPLDEHTIRIISATQPIIIHFLVNETDKLRERKTSFAGVLLRNANLVGRNLNNLNFGGIWFENAALCNTQFDMSNLEGARFTKSGLTDSSFNSANLNNAKFNGSNLTTARLIEAIGSNSDFSSSTLAHANFSKAKLVSSSFESSALHYAVLTDTILTNANFIYADLEHTYLAGASLAKADFGSSNLNDSDFSNTDLQETLFFRNDTYSRGIPRLPSYFSTQGRSLGYGDGAFVYGANFLGSKNIDNQTQNYLCQWAAMNVPGGCAGIPQENLSYLLRIPRFSSPSYRDSPPCLDIGF